MVFLIFALWLLLTKTQNNGPGIGLMLWMVQSTLERPREQLSRRQRWEQLDEAMTADQSYGD
jgi:hypothetical protein